MFLLALSYHFAYNDGNNQQTIVLIIYKPLGIIKSIQAIYIGDYTRYLEEDEVGIGRNLGERDR